MSQQNASQSSPAPPEDQKPAEKKQDSKVSLCSSFADPHHNNFYAFLQLLLSLFQFGAPFMEYGIGACKPALLPWLGINHTQFGLMLGLAQLGGIFTGPIAAYLEKKGLTMSSVVTSTVLFLGGVAFAIGVNVRSFALCVVGEIVFKGVSYWMMAVRDALTCRHYETGKRLTNAVGWTLVFVRLGQILAYFFAPSMVQGWGVVWATWTEIFVMAISLASVFLFAYLYRFTPKARQAMKDWHDGKPIVGELRRFHRADIPPGFTFKALKNVTFFAWVFVISLGAFYGAVWPFLGVATDMLKQTYGMTSTTAGKLTAVIPFLSLGIPLLSSVLDTTRSRLVGCALGGLLSVVAFLLFMLKANGIVGIVILGLSVLVYTVSCRSVIPALAVNQEMKGTLLGMSFGLQSLFMLIGNFGGGAIRDSTHSYTRVMLFYMMFSLASIIMTIYVLLRTWNLDIIASLKHFQYKDPPPESQNPNPTSAVTSSTSSSTTPPPTFTPTTAVTTSSVGGMSVIHMRAGDVGRSRAITGALELETF